MTVVLTLVLSLALGVMVGALAAQLAAQRLRGFVRVVGPEREVAAAVERLRGQR